MSISYTFNPFTGNFDALSLVTLGTANGLSITSDQVLSLTLSSSSTTGALSSTDWNTFNNKFNLPALTAGSVLFSDGTTIAQDNANFFWDNSTKRLFIGSNASIAGSNAGIQYSNAAVANRGQIKLHSYFNGNSIAGVSTLTSRSGTVGVNAAVVAGQEYSKWTAQAGATTPGSAPISGTWAFLANTVNSLTVSSDYRVQLTNLAGTLGDRLYLSSEGALRLSNYSTGVAHFDSSGNITSSAVSLTADVSGVLPTANGGTGAAGGFTPGSVVYIDGSGNFSQDNSNFFWDQTNKRLSLQGHLSTAALGLIATGSEVGLSVSSTASNTALDVANEGAQFVAQFTNSTNSATQGAAFGGAFSRGTITARTAVQAGDQVATWSGQSYNGTSFGPGYNAALAIIATQNQTSSANGGQLTIATTPNGSLAPVPGLTVNQDQTIQMPHYTTNGFVKFSGANGTLAVDTNTYITGNQTITLSGDVTGSGATAITTTLATVNSNVGSFGSSTSIPSFTVNAKGLITAASGNAVIAPAGTLSGTTLNSTVVTSSLTSVGTITSGTWNGTTIAIANGGTGQVTKAAAFDALSPMTTGGDLIYGGASGTGTRLPNGNAGTLLRSGGGTNAPSWTTAVYPSTVTINQLLYASGSSTISGLSTANTSALVTNSTGVPAWTSGTTANRVLRTDGTTIAFSLLDLTTDVTGALPIASGGTGQTTKAAAFDALSPMTTGGDIIYGGASGTGTRLANGSSGQYLKSNGGTTAPSWASLPSSTSPLTTTYTSGSGNHTITGTPLYAIIELAGGGGGGSGGGGGAGAGGAGGNTTFNVLAGNAGAGGNTGAAAGGTASLGGNPGVAISGGVGGPLTNLVNSNGGNGGVSAFGGSGMGGGSGGAGSAGATNSGSGGGGGAAPVSAASGAGGGAGGYVWAKFSTPSGSYAYAVGAAGTAGAAGTGGAGAAGGSGVIIITEYYG